MQFSLAYKGNRFVVGILMSIVLLLPQLNLASHNPISSMDASIERHSILGSSVSDNSPHNHENGTVDEALQLHQHGHNSADHSHFSLNLCSESVQYQVKSSVGSSGYDRRHLSPTLTRLQRPPKQHHFS